MQLLLVRVLLSPVALLLANIDVIMGIIYVRVMPIVIMGIVPFINIYVMERVLVIAIGYRQGATLVMFASQGTLSGLIIVLVIRGGIVPQLVDMLEVGFLTVVEAMSGVRPQRHAVAVHGVVGVVVIQVEVALYV